ncbi:GyrI-like domain-containing protein [Pandoraea norimbergensis]|uniref:GyrI-like small molecule binding domain-containing protein n=1 Tax=Pandoraea norimbergensis TaxID=93219 RepID=A0ABN4JLY8_9BURK|nr:GyrI-like domain-containing protein [Pandoraea norimbergensis]ALS62077.1 hypothetical protein AT302_22085 [Pandoraea norimbergensis]
MEKFDVKKSLRSLYTGPVGDFALVDVPPQTYFMIDGQGDPNTAQAYREAVEALYATSYTLKFMCKAMDEDYVVPPLEGLWWSDDMGDFAARRKDRWSWTLMILIPDFVAAALTERAIAAAHAKKTIPALARLRYEVLTEGRCVQTLHIGPYDAEGPILARLHNEFLPSNGLVETGRHHEIYLSDPRKVAPEKCKTILRQPVAPA